MTETAKHQLGNLIGANRRDHYYELHYSSGQQARLYLLRDGLFRFFLDPTGKFDEERGQVQLDQFDQKTFAASKPRATSDAFIIKSGSYQLIFSLKPSLLTVYDERLHRNRFSQLSPFELGQGQNDEIIKENRQEFFFGGGMQNGRYSHKGQVISLVGNRITGNGGVLSPSSFFWSNAGYGEFRNNQVPAKYDFGASHPGAVILKEQTDVIDNFYLFADSPAAMIQLYYQLRGKPLMPAKYLLQFGYWDNFVNKYWQPSNAKSRRALQFEDGNYYLASSQADQASGQASYNSEERYQFSARAMIDRFHKQQFALGWFLPNYGQKQTDLRSSQDLNQYAQLHQVASGSYFDAAVGQVAKGTRFAFGQTDYASQFSKCRAELEQEGPRPLILVDHNLAGKESSAALAFTDPENSWETISSQIASLLGAALSGQNLTGAAVAGGQKQGNARLALRDLEWKVFTPLFFANGAQASDKTPFAYNHKISRINRAYFQLRKWLAAYLYNLFHASLTGNAIMRPLFWEFPHEELNYRQDVQNEFMLGPNLLIAPIVNGRENSQGQAIKNNLYLPDHDTIWIDLFTGKKYAGGRNYNNLTYSSWHLPVFVRGGAIMDLGQRHFLCYPQGQSQATAYEDSGENDYQANHCQTHLTSQLSDQRFSLQIDQAQGAFPGQKKEQPTQITVLCDHYPDKVQVKINQKPLSLQEYGSAASFAQAKEGYFYNADYQPLAAFSDFTTTKQPALQLKLAARDIHQTQIEVQIDNLDYGKNCLVHAITDSLLRAPKKPMIDSKKITSHSLTAVWPQLSKEVEIEVNGIIYSGISGDHFTFHELQPNRKYVMRLRYLAGRKVSEWSEIFGGITKKDPLDLAIKEIKTAANYPSKPDHPLSYLTDGLTASEWQTASAIKAEQPLVLTFDFGQIEKLSRMVIVPRTLDDNGSCGQAKIELSRDGSNFSSYQDQLAFKHDSKNKVVGLRDVQARAIRLTLSDFSGEMAALKEVLFFKAKN